MFFQIVQMQIMTHAWSDYLRQCSFCPYYTAAVLQYRSLSTSQALSLQLQLIVLSCSHTHHFLAALYYMQGLTTSESVNWSCLALLIGHLLYSIKYCVKCSNFYLFFISRISHKNVLNVSLIFFSRIKGH